MADFFTFTLILDDVVFPNGRSAMALLGGGGPQTAFGMRLWADRVGLVAGVGHDFPPAAAAWLANMGIDQTGLMQSDTWPTLRAWQLLEEDGRRTHVWRTPPAAIWPQLGRRWEAVPPVYYQAQGVHLGVHLEEEMNLSLLHQLRQQGMVVSVETFRPVERPLTPTNLYQILQATDIFSANAQEAASIVGQASPQEMAQRLITAGARLVTLRLGENGALVCAASGESWLIPAWETAVVDPVGAGNAFCGGFLASWVQTADLYHAGLCGSVAASYLVEQVGLPAPRPSLHEDAQRRLALLKSRA